MTNYERIKNMSVDELATELLRIARTENRMKTQYQFSRPSCPNQDFYEACCMFERCKQCWSVWLNEEVEE